MEWNVTTFNPLIIDKRYTSFKSLLREEQKVYGQHLQELILNNGIDCSNPSVPNQGKIYTPN